MGHRNGKIRQHRGVGLAKFTVIGIVIPLPLAPHFVLLSGADDGTLSCGERPSVTAGPHTAKVQPASAELW